MQENKQDQLTQPQKELVSFCHSLLCKLDHENGCEWYAEDGMTNTFERYWHRKWTEVTFGLLESVGVKKEEAEVVLPTLRKILSVLAEEPRVMRFILEAVNSGFTLTSPKRIAGGNTENQA